MVVCKCRKATKLYCFVHKVPVCVECFCFPEHQTCVVRTYSEWVIDGEYDQPKCCQCQATFDDGADAIHTSCLVSLIKSFPPHTAPGGYVCPSCSTPIWPPKMVKDAGSRFHAQLTEVILQTGLEKNFFGNHPVSGSTESRNPPPAFASDVSSSSHAQEGKNLPDRYSLAGNGEYSKSVVSEVVEIDVPSSAGNYMKTSSPGFAAAARKGVPAVDRQNSKVLYYEDDEDGNKKKYSRRGPLRHKFLRALLPFWSSALPTLPVTAPPRKDATKAEDGLEGRVRHRSSRMDIRKILLLIAIIACMATMAILYYRLAQRVIGQEIPDEEQQ
ncbi:hypothetical protein N665_0239s0002 [Sinapis alba]|nr:hypothetical protein N665_0239s0002 [Sinapis alba]